MHDFDRTQLEVGEQEWESHEFGHEYEDESETDQFLGGILKGVLGGDSEFESGSEFESEASGELDEVQELELASELLEVANEDELEEFLGDLIKKAASGVMGFARSPQGKALGTAVKTDVTKALKQTALGVLPNLGKAVGGYWGGGEQGAKWGQALGGAAQGALSKLFGMELEGLSHEDREFEIAKQFVRFATATAQNAARGQGYGPPRVVARRAVAQAAQRYAPGLVEAAPALAAYAGPGSGGQASGRWVRSGSSIVLDI